MKRSLELALDAHACQKLLGALEFGVMILDEELNIHFWNDWLVTYTHVSAERAQNERLEQLFPEVKKPSLIRHLKSTLALQSAMFYGSSLDPYFIKIKLQRLLNPVFDFMQQAVTLLPFDRHKKWVALVIEDQSHLKEVQQTLESKIQDLQRSGEHYLWLLNHQLLYVTMDRSNRITFVTQAFLDLAHLEPSEVLGKRVDRFFEAKNEEVELDIQNLWRKLERGTDWLQEVCLNRQTQAEVWLRLEISASQVKPGAKDCALVMQDITDKKKLERLSSVDPLTKVYNRKKFNEFCHHQLEVAKRYATVFSIGLFNLDNFKLLNDQFGHQIGDQVLVQVSTICSTNLRRTDRIARWGGEEFILLFPHSDLFETQAILEKIRVGIEGHSFGEVEQVTVSFGATAYRKEDLFNDLLERANRALSKSKHDGKNRITLF